MRTTRDEPVDLVAEGDRAVLRCHVCGAQLSVPFTREQLSNQAAPFFAAHEHRGWLAAQPDQVAG